ncbi:hypothetical protein FHL15_002776 [Xylaria flabelliformis]|uniref:Uncharacterized protein n=1 Tax=Xylaria flabelliformis TaxID=2512241 RepID=A0A553I8J1_9PEZI|nr:hypothetical protein FHL15_002776 [Xylaria flabelliformis]
MEVPNVPPAGPPKRRLFKGTLKPLSTRPTGKSYTLAPASISEVVIKDAAGRPATRCPSTAISSTAVPQPFVDPAVLQRRPPSS